MPQGASIDRWPDPEVVAEMLPRLGWMHSTFAFVLRESVKSSA